MPRFHSFPLAALVLFAAVSAHAQFDLYWTGGNGNSVQASAANGANVTNLVTGISTPLFGITYADTGIFFAGQNGDVRRMDTDGSDVSFVLSMNVSRGIVQTADHVYIANANGRVFRGTYNGTTLPVDPAIVAINGASFMGITADSNYLYWTDINNHLIQRSDLNGGGVTTLVSTGLNTPYDIQATADYLYWADQGNNVIQRSDLSGNHVTTLIASTFLTSPTGIYVTDNYLYFTQLNSGIYRASLDDFSSIEQLVTGGSNYRFLDGPVSAIPESSTYAALAGVTAFALALRKRRVA